MMTRMWMQAPLVKTVVQALLSNIPQLATRRRGEKVKNVKDITPKDAPIFKSTMIEKDLASGIMKMTMKRDAATTSQRNHIKCH